MARKTRLTRQPTGGEHILGRLRHIDLQRENIMRGLPFERIGDSVLQHQSFFLQHWNENPDHTLLNKFDDWRKAHIIHKDVPFIPLGFRETDDDGNTVKIKKPRGIRKKKKRRERNKELGIFSGTKKELTMTSQRKGLTLEETIEKVKESFPDANEKSIGIWYKKSRRMQKS